MSIPVDHVSATVETRSDRWSRVLALWASWSALLALSLAFLWLMALNVARSHLEDAVVSQYGPVLQALALDLDGVQLPGAWERPPPEIRRVAERARERLTAADATIRSSIAAGSGERVATGLSVVSPKGTALFGSRRGKAGPRIPPAVVRDALDVAGRTHVSRQVTVRGDEAYFLTLPLGDPETDRAWVAVVDVDQGMVHPRVERFAQETLRIAVTLFWVLTVFLLPVAILSAGGLGRESPSGQRLFSRIVMATIGSVLLAMSWWLIERFDHEQAQTSEVRWTLTATLLRDVVEEAVATDPQGGLTRMVEAFPDVSRLALESAPGIASDVVATSSPSAFGRIGALIGDLVPSYRTIHLQVPSGPVGPDVVVLGAEMSPADSSSRLGRFAAELGTATVLALLLLWELVLVSVVALGLRTQAANQAESVAYRSLRPAMFFFLFGVDLSLSFLPLHMEKIYEPMLGLPRDFVIGLPISVEFLFVGLALLAGGAWLDRRGWLEPFSIGLGLAGVGTLWSWMAPDATQFLLSRAVVGTGYGLALLAAQGCVIATTGPRSRTRGLAELFAGLYGGSICGAAAGGMLAERLGFEAVFLLSAVIIFALLPYTFVLVARNRAMLGVTRAVEAPPPPPKGALRNFITNRVVLAVVLFSSLPASIAAIGFLNYFSPVYLSRLGVPQSTIGQILMLYGIVIVLAGPWISRLADITGAKRLVVFVGALLGCAAFLSFHVWDGVWGTTVAIMMLGLSACFVLAAQSAYVLSLDVSMQLGAGKAIGVFRATSRLGQMLGPFVFGALLASGQLERALRDFGLIYLAASLLFLVLTARDRPVAQTTEATR
ncbi:MAG: MFS transporter [Ectothiorhodospiraceae bacterium]|nr:MFS transporter [Chromatiales bacterium]MCP5154564.1 MFS transporter [Ectothiorhodospiraceae bacterium]